MCPKPFSWAKNKRKLFSDGKSRGPLLAGAALKVQVVSLNILLFIQCGALLVVVSLNIQVLLIKIRDFFQHLRYSHFSKFSTLSRYRIRGPTRSEISRQLLVWAYHEWCVRFYVRRACKVLFLPEISSQNTAAFCIRCIGGDMALRLSRFSFPVSRVFAMNAWNFWCENYTFGDQIRRRTACSF